MEGRIVKNISNDYVVKIGDNLYNCKPRGKFRKDKLIPLVGDIVEIDTKNNYIYYSGLIYRILYIDKDTLYVITDECVTNLKYGENNRYSDSEVKKWLEEVYLNNPDNPYLKSNEVKLLDKDTYGKIGEKESFVIDKDFWVLDNDEALVITEDGMLTKTSNYKDFLGVKPVIKLKGTNKYIKGDGAIDNPYI